MAAVAAAAAIKLVQSYEGQSRKDLLWKRAKQLSAGTRSTASHTFTETMGSAVERVPASTISSPIIPIIIGAESAAVSAGTRLREQGIFVPAIRYPTVARGSARLRVTLTASHSADDVATLAHALAEIVNRQS